MSNEAYRLVDGWIDRLLPLLKGFCKGADDELAIRYMAKINTMLSDVCQADERLVHHAVGRLLLADKTDEADVMINILLKKVFNNRAIPLDYDVQIGPQMKPIPSFVCKRDIKAKVFMEDAELANLGIHIRGGCMDVKMVDMDAI